MAYGLRLRGEWQDKLGGLTRFDITERDYTGNAEVMEMQEDPLTIERAQLTNKFTPTIGSGIQLKVTATYDGQYISLYTKDKQKFKGSFYKNNQLIWTGYLNSEVYGEQFDRMADYPVTLQFNDGFTVLERIKFLDANGNPYTDLKTAWEVIWIILAKLGIDYKYVYVACDIYEENMNTLTSPFHQMKVDCNNYYDEKGDAMNCREVLEAIVKAQRAICFQNEGCLNIVSVPLLTGSFERRRYTSEVSVQVLQTVNPVITVPTQADWYGSDQAIDIQSGYNKATLKYSPYSAEEVVETGDFSDIDLWEGDHSWEDVGDYFELQGVTGLKGWTMLNGTSFSGTKEEEVDENEVYIKLPFANDSAQISLLENNESSNLVTGSLTQGFKVSFKIYIATKDNEFDNDEESKKVVQLAGYFAIEVDGKRPEALSDDPWVWSVNSFLKKFGADGSNQNIADQWKEINSIIPGNCPHGRVKIQILKKFTALKDTLTNMPVDSGTIKHIRIKDIEVVPINLSRYTAQSGRIGFNEGAVDFSDLEFNAEMDDEWLNEADDIEMIHGDSKENNCTDKGGLHLLDNSFTSAWKTPVDAVYYDIAKLYLRSYVSNYRDSLRQLSGTLEAPNFFNGDGLNINGILSFHSVLTYPSSSLGARKLMFMGGTYNDKRQTLNGTWLEVLPDDLTINSL
ncbi:hypothetical protein BZG01_00230 [Labilibaculum manganireducens]|uniref:Uncharacterized protein n=1 Tax=Labilibaculum manganireducens TaxID=1940525 RepID=A0A2N3IGE7_9BACT|nr:hypothetical protein [Labilibaculum manganireducens]PKQ69400.1 hypothetical protein BZG01_00230 [Labilibaculum manganireducens]